MKQTLHSKLLLGAAVILPLAGALVSCKEAEESVAVPAVKESNALSGIFVKAAPEGAVAISTAIADAKPGDEITISGEIMGKMDPFIDGRAMVMIGDPTTLTPCNRIPGDTCETPWDVCCDDPEVIAKSVATIQVLDEEGRPLKTGLKGAEGMKELSFLTVTGTIAEGSNPENLLVNATGIHVAEESPFKDAPPVGDAHAPAPGAMPHDHDGDGKPDH